MTTHLPKILVVEDDPDIHEWLNVCFGSLAQLVFAPSIVAATSQLEADDYQLILMDQHLTDGLGTELLLKLRAGDGFTRNQETNVVMCTSSRDPVVFEDAWMGGSVAFVAKPIDYDTLALAMERGLGSEI